ncbi:hypothetical protein DFH08DRAFT_939208 [Mycena albidolilacea]|uniref:Uncharacterized protein n=1 Tax=Mycena albidolilacea TaxID=1033008 RepID=A0AAD6ZTV9_9AGAR|nr:hypothetical protein DFH08DRAFT_939208 [Mycena albidolilacea]
MRVEATDWFAGYCPDCRIEIPYVMWAHGVPVPAGRGRVKSAPEEGHMMGQEKRNEFEWSERRASGVGSQGRPRRDSEPAGASGASIVGTSSTSSVQGRCVRASETGKGREGRLKRDGNGTRGAELGVCLEAGIGAKLANRERQNIAGAYECELVRKWLQDHWGCQVPRNSPSAIHIFYSTFPYQKKVRFHYMEVPSFDVNPT